MKVPVYDWREKSMIEISAEEKQMGFTDHTRYWMPEGVSGGKSDVAMLAKLKANVKKRDKAEPGIKWVCFVRFAYGVMAYAWR